MEETREHHMKLFAPAKLTLSLRITGVRSDGYHLIDAEMTSLDFGDTLEVTEGETQVTMSDFQVPQDDNLITKALNLARRSAQVTVQKQIPAGAGLGGGSSNAAAILRWAGFTDTAQAVSVNTGDAAVAASLGGDVPFCLVGGRARVTGIGEIIEPLPFQEQQYTLLIPPFGCNTAAVYAAWDEIAKKNHERPYGENGNDLEPAAVDLYPDLLKYKDQLGNATGITPQLAGGGSTYFVPGAFPGENRIVANSYLRR